MPATMNAALLMGHGGTDQLLYRGGVPVPTPDSDEVLIHVGAAGVNNTDINMRVSWYSQVTTAGTADVVASGPTTAVTEDGAWTGGTVTFPLIQGADVCGVISATGANVPASRIGQRALVDPVLRNRAAGLISVFLFRRREYAEPRWRPGRGKPYLSPARRAGLAL